MRGLWLSLTILLVACGQQASARAEGEGWVAILEWSPKPPVSLQPARLVLRVQDDRGNPLSLEGLQAEADMEEMAHDPEPVQFRLVGDGVYETTHTFSMDGSWSVRVEGRWRGGQLRARFTVSVGR